MKKKNIAITVCLATVVACLAGCAGKAPEKEDVYQANLTETLLQGWRRCRKANRRLRQRLF